MDPTSLLPEKGVSWETEADDVIVARFDVPPDRAEVRLGIDAERRFGDLIVPRGAQCRLVVWDGAPSARLRGHDPRGSLT